MRLEFFFQMLQIFRRFWKCNKVFLENGYFLKEMHLNWLQYIPRTLMRITSIGRQRFNRRSREYKSYKGSCFPNLSVAECSKSGIKVRFCILAEWLGRVSTFTAEGFSETRPAIHSSIQLFWIEQFSKYSSYDAGLFFANVQNFI